MKANRVKRQAGVQVRIPIGPTADRLNDLRRTYTLGYIGQVTGISDGELSRISRRKHPTVHVEVARRVAAFKPRAGTNGHLDVTGTRRRLQALAFAGWSFAAVARRVGGTDDALSKIARGRTDKVSASKAERVEALFRELWDQPGGDVRASNMARRRGWLPALAWDCIDDPDERPATVTVLPSSDVDEVAVERAMRGDRVALTPAERAEVVRRLSEGGETLNRIATLLHSSIPRVREIRRRHGIESSYDPQRSAS